MILNLGRISALIGVGGNFEKEINYNHFAIISYMERTRNGNYST